MRVTGVEVITLKAPRREDYWGFKAWKGDYEPHRRRGADLDTSYPLRWRRRHRWATTINTCLVKLTTDEGIVGYGESKAPIAPGAVEQFITEYLQHFILDEDPFHTRVLWDRYQSSMYGRGHVQGYAQEAAAGLDIACWDIIGKATNRPIADLLGGAYRQSIPVYYSGLAGLPSAADGAERERLAADAQRAIDEGFDAVKIAIGFGLRADLASVDVVREAVGDDVLVLVDALGSYDYPRALAMAGKLADRNVGWFETPLPIDDLDGYVELGRRAPIQIANDFLWVTGLVKEVLRAGGRMVCIPEVIKSGITESARIARLADDFGVPYAPHMSIGSAIQFAATAHLAAAAPNLVISEYWASPNPLGNDLLVEPLAMEDGHLRVPSGPGLGIELDEERIEALAAGAEAEAPWMR